MPDGQDGRKMDANSLANLKLWQKGTSGNPSGRPKRDENLAKAAREYTEEALNTLVGLMRGAEKESVRKDSAIEILNRGWGRAPVTVQVGDSSDQLDAFRETLLEAVQHASSGLSSVTVIDQQATGVVIVQPAPAVPAASSLIPKDITPKK